MPKHCDSDSYTILLTLYGSMTRGTSSKLWSGHPVGFQGSERVPKYVLNWWGMHHVWPPVNIYEHHKITHHQITKVWPSFFLLDSLHCPQWLLHSDQGLKDFYIQCILYCRCYMPDSHNAQKQSIKFNFFNKDTSGIDQLQTKEWPWCWGSHLTNAMKNLSERKARLQETMNSFTVANPCALPVHENISTSHSSTGHNASCIATF